MEQGQSILKTKELLINWSKWLITINFVAGTGCVAALKDAAATVERTGVFFFGAILCFSLSIICASLFVFLLSKNDTAVGQQQKIGNIWLAKLQLLFFTLGIGFVLIWIAFLSKVV